MKRKRAGMVRRKNVYWWNEQISGKLRKKCSAWRRRLIRAKRRGTQEVVSQLAGELNDSRKALRKAISRAKKEAWEELLEGLNGDPWGRPYKKIMEKLKEEDINICGKLPVDKIGEILGKLFPRDRGINMYTDKDETERQVPGITEEEMNTVIKRAKRKGKKAPGPDGIQAGLMAEAQINAKDTYRGLYDGCLRAGIFPKRWKVAKVVLLKKGGKPDGEASSYRPLYLLNEEGKIFEGIIKNRMEESMREEGKELSVNQYGFKKRRSTVDAILRVKEVVEGNMKKGMEVLAMSVDVKNAFNTIEWGEIRRAVKGKNAQIFEEYNRKLSK